jgi:hypothetical protein
MDQSAGLLMVSKNCSKKKQIRKRVKNAMDFGIMDAVHMERDVNSDMKK